VNSKYCAFKHDGFVVNLVGSSFNTNLEYILIRKERQKRFRALVKSYRYLSAYKIKFVEDVDQNAYLKTYIRILGNVDNSILQEEIDFWGNKFGYKISDKSSEDSSIRELLNIPESRIISSQGIKNYNKIFDRQMFFGRTIGKFTKKYVLNIVEHKISSMQIKSKVNLAKVLLCQIYLVHNQELLQFYVCEK